MKNVTTTVATTVLSPKAATVRREFLNISKQADQIGWQACHDRIHQMAGTLDADTAAELQLFLVGIKPETTKMRNVNAARVLEDTFVQFPLALALRGEAKLTVEQRVKLFEPAATDSTYPEWIRETLKEQLAVANAAIEKAKLPPPPPKPVAPADPLVGLRKQFEDYLSQLERGRWCTGHAREAEKGLSDAQRTALSDILERVHSTVEPCYLRARTVANDQLEAVGLRRAAEALYDDAADVGVLYDVMKAKNVHGWIKDLIHYRIGQLERKARESEQAERLAETDNAVTSVVALIGRVLKIAEQATDMPHSMGVALLGRAEAMLEEIRGTQVHYGLLEGLIDGQGAEDCFVQQMLQDVAPLATVVAAAAPKTKGAAFHRELLRPAREAVEELRRKFGEAEEPKPEPVEVVKKEDGKRKKYHPNLLANHKDSPRKPRPCGAH